MKSTKWTKSLFKKSFLKKIKTKFHFDFHDLLQTFDLIITKNLSFHCFYDHKIDFVDDFHTMRNRVYSLFYLKLMKLKKYLKIISERTLLISVTFYFFQQYYLLSNLMKNFAVALIIANSTLSLNAMITSFFSLTRLWLNSLNVNTS